MRPFWDLIFLSFYSPLVIVRRSLFHWAVTFNSSRQLSEQDLVGAFKCNIDYFVLKRAIGSSLSHDWQVGDLSSVDKLSSSTRSTNTMTLLKTFSLHLQMEYIRYMNRMPCKSPIESQRNLPERSPLDLLKRPPVFSSDHLTKIPIGSLLVKLPVSDHLRHVSDHLILTSRAVTETRMELLPLVGA